MVTIIPLSSAPNPWVGPLTVQWHLSFFTHLPFFLHTFGEGEGLKTVEWKSPKLVVPINTTQILHHNCVQLVT